MFVDEVRILVRGGNGGNGMVAFQREKYLPRGGPSGGDGGNGGSVFLFADPQRTTLADFRHKRRFKAGDGEHGQSDNCHGKSADDVVIPVPCGTLVYADDKLIADLSQPGARLLVARGGRGGLGNQHYATASRQAPKFAQRGEPGEEAALRLELKLLADAGIVGAPNAGKSTLLSAVSSARPKIADYPFTTLEPQLGVVQIDVDVHFVLVDLPGLVAGASQGTGLGDKFLRHVERTNVLVHLIDGGVEPADALQQMQTIEQELALWSAALLRKPRLLAVSKQDLPAAHAVLAAVRETAAQPVFGISAATGQGVKALMSAAYEAIVAARPLQVDATAADPSRLSIEVDSAAGKVTLRPKPAEPASAVSVAKEGKGYRVSSPKLELLAKMTDLQSPDGREYFKRVLLRSGAWRKLKKLGARTGDKVRVGPAELLL